MVEVLAAILAATQAGTAIASLLEGPGGELLRDLFDGIAGMADRKQVTQADLDLIQRAMNAKVQQAHLALVES